MGWTIVKKKTITRVQAARLLRMFLGTKGVGGSKLIDDLLSGKAEVKCSKKRCTIKRKK